VTRAIEEKARIDLRAGAERTGWYVLDGVKRLRVSLPTIHCGDIPPGTTKSIRQQLKLSGREFSDFVTCPMTCHDYEQLIREKIASGQI
jgi:hypothetical protein